MKSKTYERQRRMKKEVKYDRMSCTTVKESHALFRLKKNHADLDAEEYADNLISYLDNARSIKSITLTDLNNVLHGLTMTPFLKSDVENTNSFVVGEYVAAVWFEDTTYEWYLGVIEHINPSNTKGRCKRQNVGIPDKAQLVETEAEQILMRTFMLGICDQ